MSNSTSSLAGIVHLLAVCCLICILLYLYFVLWWRELLLHSPFLSFAFQNSYYFHVNCFPSSSSSSAFNLHLHLTFITSSPRFISGSVFQFLFYNNPTNSSFSMPKPVTCPFSPLLLGFFSLQKTFIMCNNPLSVLF